MKEFIEKKYIKYYLGNKLIRTHIDAVHAVPPQADQFTGEIVTGIIDKINCSGIIAKISRTQSDLNRGRDEKNKEAIDEYRSTIYKILTHLNTLEERSHALKQPYLHLAIHGMEDSRGKEIIIGTKRGESCSADVEKWFVHEMIRYYKNIEVNNIFPGDPSKSVHRQKYGENFNTIQIEINRTLRENHQKELINSINNIILKFNESFNSRG